ncbi:MAG: hypothetical protein ACHQWU_03890 [Gemmatimonadales bacterium]
MARAIGLATAVMTLGGCYTLQPTGGPVPEVGSRIAFDVNDAGRAALGGAMGPEIDQIEGLLVERDTADYLVAVSAVHLLRGGDQIWSGEQVHIKSAYVSRTYERRFSAGRTVVLSAIGVAAVAAFVSQTLIGSGADSPSKPSDSTGATVRLPVGVHRLPHLGRP